MPNQFIRKVTIAFDIEASTEERADHLFYCALNNLHRMANEGKFKLPEISSSYFGAWYAHDDIMGAEMLHVSTETPADPDATEAMHGMIGVSNRVPGSDLAALLERLKRPLPG